MGLQPVLRGIFPSQRQADHRKCSQSSWKGRQGNPARSPAAVFSDFSCSNSWLFWRLPQTQGPIFSAGLSFLMCCCCQKKKNISGSCKRNLGVKAPFIMQIELVYQIRETGMSRWISCASDGRALSLFLPCRPAHIWPRAARVPALCHSQLPAEEGLPNCREVSEESQAQVVTHILRVTSQPRVFRSV